jgi:hypothetical protein
MGVRTLSNPCRAGASSPLRTGLPGVSGRRRRVAPIMTADEFRERLQAKGVSAACPACRAEDWRGLDEMITLPVRGAGTARHGAPTRVPLVAVAPSCGRCGYIFLFDPHFLQS